MEFRRRTLIKVAVTGASELQIHGHILPPAVDQAPLVVNQARQVKQEAKGVVETWLNVISFSEQEKKSLGDRIQNWTLPDGSKMSILSPELYLAGEVYKVGSIKSYIPQARDLQVVYDRRQKVGALNLLADWDESSASYILVSGPSIRPFKIPELKSLSARISFNPKFHGTFAELVLAAKEASQIADYLMYSRFHLALLRGQGAKYEIHGRKLSEDELSVTVAVAQTQIEMENSKVLWFRDFVDYGSSFRVGSIAYMDWYINYFNQEKSVIPIEFVKAGIQAAGYLQQARWLDQVARGHAVWVRGRAPMIENGEVRELYVRF